MNTFLKLICSSIAIFAIGSSGFSEELSDNGNGRQACPTSCPKPASCDKPQACPTPCPKPACPTSCPKPACPPKPKCEKPKCMEMKYCPAYNGSADIEVKCGWDLEIDASFIYWHVSQDYMDYGIQTDVPGVSPAVTTRKIALPDFEYKPGFKVGFGFDIGHDDWKLNAEYLWIRNTIHTTHSASTGHSWANNDWFQTQGGITGARSITSKWKMNMDILDVLMSRPYWEGKHLTVVPHVGLRALWMRQAYKINIASSSLVGLSKNRSQDWALGPNFGFNGNWLLGKDFRFEGNAAASLLYTRYTKITHQDDTRTVATGLTTINQASSPEQSRLTPMAEAGLGFGWGTYFNCCRYHVDFAARYDFMILWSQNKMREWIGMQHGWVDDAGDLYLHGLTVQVRFDF